MLLSVMQVCKKHLNFVGKSFLDTLFAIPDRASVNIAAVKLMQPPEGIGASKKDGVTLVGCLAHTVDNAGGKMKESLKFMPKFLTRMAKMMKMSTNAKLEYHNTFGRGNDIAYSIRWWSWFEATVNLYKVSQMKTSLSRFFQELMHKEISKKTRRKAVFDDESGSVQNKICSLWGDVCGTSNGESFSTCQHSAAA